MAHIASCMVDANVEEQDGFSRHHEKTPYPQSSIELVRMHSPQTLAVNFTFPTIAMPDADESIFGFEQNERSSTPANRTFVRGMQQPAATKYQLFPKDTPITLAAGKGLHPEKAFIMAIGQNAEKTDTAAVSNSQRPRINEHNINRRRKISVPELGPMTTVQELAMDFRGYHDALNP